MRRLTLSILVLVAPAACGRGEAGIGQVASKQLTPQVQQIRAAVTSGDAAATAAKLAELRRTVVDLRQGGALTDAGATEVLAAAAEVEAGIGVGGAPAQVAPLPGQSASTPSSSSTQTPSTTAPARSGSRDTQPAPPGKGEGKGGGKGGKP